MPIAAVPRYIDRRCFRSASPGLRFGMYLELWGVNSRTKSRLWTTYDKNYRTSGKNRTERPFNDENKTSSLTSANRLSSIDSDICDSLRTRQRMAFDGLATAGKLSLMASSVAPFSTGLGNEHPLENGFAFLSPYGLPYLPGSGVKGVVRRAAEELAEGKWGDTGGWNTADDYTIVNGVERSQDSAPRLSMIDVLFGPQTDSEHHLRGVLDFWDVIPSINGNRLNVEIMTPHQSHYYQAKRHMGSNTPHDSGLPNPISFLTVPPESEFDFHVRCDLVRLDRLAPELAENGHWKRLLRSAFEHAFEWLGFGAKTAVGYGAMRRDTEREARARRDAEARAQKARETKERAERLANMDPVDREIEQFLAERQDKGMPETTAILQALKSDRWTGSERLEVARRLKARMQDAGVWKETSQARKPERDKSHQNTLAVMSMLQGE